MFPSTETLLTWHLRGQLIIVIIVVIGWICIAIWAIREWIRLKNTKNDEES